MLSLIHIAVWPLLSNSFVVDHVAISGFKARVVRNKDGQFNFSNLVGGTAPVVATPANPAEALAGAAQTAAQALKMCIRDRSGCTFMMRHGTCTKFEIQAAASSPSSTTSMTCSPTFML